MAAAGASPCAAFVNAATAPFLEHGSGAGIEARSAHPGASDVCRCRAPAVYLAAALTGWGSAVAPSAGSDSSASINASSIS